MSESNYLQISIKVSKILNKRSNESSYPLLKVKLFSEWLDCSCISDTFGEENLSFVDTEDENIKISKYITNFKPPDLMINDKLQIMNNNPSIYAVFFINEVEPVGFISIDCSSFLIEKNTLEVNNIKILEYEVDMIISITTPLLSLQEALNFEPVLINLGSLDAYPILDYETINDSIQSTYIYGEFDIGDGSIRSMVGFPYIKKTLSIDTNEIQNNTSIENFDNNSNIPKVNIELKVCLLPGLIGIPKVKDSFISSTVVLQIHKEDIFKRAFHKRNVAEYKKLMEEFSTTIQVDTKVAKKGTAPPAKAPPPKAPIKGQPILTNVIELTTSTPITDSDKFLLVAISKAFKTAREIRNHGTIRLRLEQLLSSSNDLLTKFAKKRKRIQSNRANQSLKQPPTSTNTITSNSKNDIQLNDDVDIEDDHVVIQEDMILEVRLEKPSKPEKWDLPADISLKSALTRANEEKQSKLDGTLALSGTVVGNSIKDMAKHYKGPPRYELFISCGTVISVTIALHRKLQSNPSTTVSTTTMKSNNETSSLSNKELENKLKTTPFTRMIILFKYLDDEILKKLNIAIEQINKDALPDIQGTIRSYSFNQEEVQACMNGSLDVITGFMILDDDWRMVVLEGLAKPLGGMSRLYIDYLPKTQTNSDSLKILCNPEVLFSERLYPEFGPDIRRIRIRDKLSKLVRRPEVYNRKQVEEICFKALDSIMSLHRASDMISTKVLDMYPTSESLSKLELLYGEAISRSDMDGSLRDIFTANFEKEKKKKEKKQNNLIDNNTMTRENLLSSSSLLNKTKEPYEPTDCRNRKFEDYLKTRPLHRIDYLAETKQLRQQAWSEMLRRREIQEEQYTKTIKDVLGIENSNKHQSFTSNEDEDDEYTSNTNNNTINNTINDFIPPKVFLYSQQKLNFKVQAMEKLRKRIEKDKNATYTFSKDFVSQTVDEFSLKEQEKSYSQSKMLTSKGMRYPQPKTRAELMLHPQRPSEARIEDLKEPFKDITDNPSGTNIEKKDPLLSSLEKGFKTQIPNGNLFGALKPVEFERDFQLKLVGNRNVLPRGKLIAGNNHDFDPHCFRSVHLGGENQAKIVEEALLKEKNDWLAKVVVDSLSVKVGGFKIRDKAIQADRTKDILHDEPQREELVFLRTRKSHKGNSWAYNAPPISILNQEEYIENAASNALLRKSDPTKYITTIEFNKKKVDNKLNKSASNILNELNTNSYIESNNSHTNIESNDDQESDNDNPIKVIDFHRYIHKDTYNTKLNSIIYKKKHPAQDPNSLECTGPKWNSYK